MNARHAPRTRMPNPTRRDLLGLAALGLATPTLLSACGGGGDSDPIEVVLNDIPYPTESNLLIGYMLSIRDDADGVTLARIAVLDDETSAELLVIEQADLPLIYRGDLGAAYGVRYDVLTRCFVSLRLAVPLGVAPPRAIRHRIVFTDGRVVEGGMLRPRTSESPLVIASPVKDRNLVIANQSTMGYHFNATSFFDGEVYTFERYAFDLVRFDDALGNFYRGNDPTLNESYFCHGLPLLAVADGVVVKTGDGLPENRGNAYDVAASISTLEGLLGNYVVLDIGGGNHATYAHCLPGSVSVRAGDRVREGQQIARLGNSGNSGAPHLHFQVSDGPDPIRSHGVPIVLDRYTIVGQVRDIFADQPTAKRVPARGVLRSMMEEGTIVDIV